MAFASTTGWDLRTTGNDANGGGFNTASAGTNYAMQDSPQVSYTDLVIDATTNTNCTSAGNPFTSAHVGNVINITGGTGFTVQRVQVVSVAAGVATCDKSLGTLSSTGGTGNLGGGLLTLSTANVTLLAPGNTLNIKSGTYTQTTVTTWPTGSSGSTSVGSTSIIGYGTTWGDGGTAPVITTATNSTQLMNFATFSSLLVKNVKFTNTAATRSNAISSTVGSGNFWHIDSCIFDGFSVAFNCTSQAPTTILFTNSTIQNGTSNGATTTAAYVFAFGCLFYNNTGDGWHCNAGGGTRVFTRCLFAKNGANGFYDADTNHASLYNLVHNTFVDNTSAGARIDETPTSGSMPIVWVNNISWGNGTYGISTPNMTAASFSGAGSIIYNNVYGKNTTADRNILPAGTGDISIGTNDPFNNRAGLDWGLNNTGGAGASVRAAGFPGTITGQSATVGYPDSGAIQHQDSGSSTAPVARSMVVQAANSY